MSIYERLVPRRMNYILFWFLVSMVIWGLFELAMFLLKETDYPLMRFLLCFLGFGFLPVFMIFLKRRFQAATQNLNQIIKIPTEDYRSWIKLETEKIFNLSTITDWTRVVFTLLIIIGLSLLTIRFFYPIWAMIILYVIACVVFTAGIHGQFVIEKLLRFLTSLETFPVQLKFAQIDHPLLIGLFRFYSQSALLTLAMLFFMALFLWVTPFQLNPMLLIAISIFAFYPAALLVWSAYKIHLMMAKAKSEHLEVILTKIQASFKHVETETSKDNVESLQKLLDLQKNVKNQLDWPINPESVTTLLFTFLVPTINFIITVWGKFSK